MAAIHFFVEQIKFALKKKRRTKQWIQQTISNENKVQGELNYVFCSDEYLLHINQTFLNHNTLTDIVTFPMEELQNNQYNPKKKNIPALELV